ncbi:MAG: class II aldolase/adducin family protein, partial [Bifidobacteriaceae bacterium]|nr:class II aldolase/adducin family protein [Bifidobacteriaceae bacterium]
MSVSITDALAEMGRAGTRLDQIHACEAGAGNISLALRSAPGLESLFPARESYPLPVAVPELAGWTVLVTASGQRLRDVAGGATATVAAVEIGSDGLTGTLRSGLDRDWSTPTSEFNSHLAVHADQVSGRPSLERHSVVHAQPPYLVSLSHVEAYRETAVFNRRILRWEPETIVQLPDGLAVLEFMVPGSKRLQEASVIALRDHRLAVWSKHGLLGRSDAGPENVVDLIEYAETGA